MLSWYLTYNRKSPITAGLNGAECWKTSQFRDLLFSKKIKIKSTIPIIKPALVLEKSLRKQLGLKGLLKDNNADFWPPSHPFFNARMALLQGQWEKRGMSGHNLPSVFPLLGLVLRVAQYRQPRKKLEQKLGGGVVEKKGVTFRGVPFFFFGHTVHKHLTVPPATPTAPKWENLWICFDFSEKRN